MGDLFHRELGVTEQRLRSQDPQRFNIEMVPVGTTVVRPVGNRRYTEYQEGLYVGYRYFATFGVEGESYTMENGEPVYTDLIINNPDGLSTFFASYVYATNAASGFFPYLNDMSRTFYDFNDNQWQVYEDLMKLSDCAYNYPAYATLTTAESTEYSTIESDMSTYMDSKILEFIIGAADVDSEFDAFVETLYDMGLQDMIDMKQAATGPALYTFFLIGLVFHLGMLLSVSSIWLIACPVPAGLQITHKHDKMTEKGCLPCSDVWSKI